MNTNKTLKAYRCTGEKERCAPVVNQFFCRCCNACEGDYDGGNGHSPYIGENGNWVEWSDEENSFVDTGVRAEGPQGETGDIGPQGVQGIPGPQGSDYQDTVITGVETITNQTIDGKTVYQMRVNLGKIAQGVTAGVDVFKNVNVSISNVADVWIDIAQMVVSGSRLTISSPYVMSSAVNSPSNYSPRRIGLAINSITTSNLELTCSNSTGTTFNDATGWAIIKYTKIV